MIRNLSLIAVFLLCASLAVSAPVRIKDLVEYEGVRANDLIGYGLVIGLDGTGDSLRNAPFTEDLISNILERLGTNVTGEAFRTKNIASVFVTAKLPPFSRAGSYIDVAVATIGDASNLRGGILVMTPLRAADGDIYAVAQGAIIAGGAAVRGAAEQIIEGVPTAGVIPSGALVEREVAFDFKILKTINLALRQADFSTAHKIETLINKNFKGAVARMLDAATVERLQRRRADLKRFFLNQGYQTVEITLTHTSEAKTPVSQSRHRIQAALAEDLSTKPQALTATAALPFGPNAAQRLTLSL